MIGNALANTIDPYGLEAFSPKWVGDGAKIDDQGQLWVGTSLVPDSPPPVGRVESDVSISWVSLKDCDGNDQTLPSTPNLNFLDRFVADAWKKQPNLALDDGLRKMADGANSLYYVLINTSVGNNSGEFPLCNEGEVEIKWKYSVYDDMGSSANYNNPSPRPKDPYAPDHDAAKTGVLRNEAEHKPWRETSPNNAPAGAGKQVESKSITIIVKWNACGSNQKSPQVTKNANPGLGNGPNRGGR